MYGAIAVGVPGSWAAPAPVAPTRGAALATYLPRESHRYPSFSWGAVAGTRVAAGRRGAARSVPRDGTATVHARLRGMSLVCSDKVGAHGYVYRDFHPLANQKC